MGVSGELFSPTEYRALIRSLAPHDAPSNTAFFTAFGPITDYSFSTSLGSTPFSVTSFNIATASATTTSVYRRALNPAVFILYPTSFFNDVAGDDGKLRKQVLVRAAVSHEATSTSRKSNVLTSN